MKKQIDQLRKFQSSFKGIVNDKPTLLDRVDYSLRFKLSDEELAEYKQACWDGNIVEIADAISDRLFLVLGDAICHGLGDVLPELFEEVVASNMSKLDEDGEPIINGENDVIDHTRPMGKILKSKQYFKPKIKEILLKHYGRI